MGEVNRKESLKVESESGKATVQEFNNYIIQPEYRANSFTEPENNPH